MARKYLNGATTATGLPARGFLSTPSSTPFCAAPGSIAQSFPALKLGDVYGTATYYLRHQEKLNSYLRHHDEEFKALRAQRRQANSALYKRLHDAKKIEEVKQSLER